MPAVGTNPIYEIVTKYSTGTNVFRNVRYYQALTEPGANVGASRLNSAYATTVLTPIAQAITDNITIVETSARRLNNLFDFHINPVGTVGVNIGVRMPSYVSVRIDLERTSKETRSGWLMVPGVLSADVSGNAIVAGAQAKYTTVANALQSLIDNGGTTFAPVLVGGKRPGGIPKTEDLWLFNSIASATAVFTVTTQNSRKTGQGE